VRDETSSSSVDEFPRQPLSKGLSSGQSTHPGRRRQQNEDHHASAPDLGFFVVADGVGGLPGGATASRLAVASMLYSVRAAGGEPAAPDDPVRQSLDPAQAVGPRLIAAAYAAHQRIQRFGMDHGCFGAATTMAALWITGGHFHAANTGDSRVYRLIEGGLERLSKDHTPYEEHCAVFGPPPPELARRMENVVTQVLGGKRSRTPAVHLVSRPLVAREVFLLCTDGLTNMVSDAEIASVLGLADSPQQAADVLVEMANAAGGVDNITCVVVYADPG
jgi:protein phosphatase